MDDGTPSLGVGFEIDTDGAFGSLTQLDSLIDSSVANAVAEFDRVKKATSGMIDLGNATAEVVAFGHAGKREYAAAAREAARVEKAGEALVRQLERQTSTFGKTRSEIRAMKVETAALAAQQAGMAELAGRLRAQEADLFAKEYAATRRARQEAEAAAEEKVLAADRAAAAAEAEQQAIKAAADAYRTFEAVAKQKSAAYRDRQAAEAAAAAQAEAQAVREAAEAYRLFEAVAKQKSAAFRDREAAEAAAAAQAEAQAVREAADAYRTFEAVAKQKSAAHREALAAEQAQIAAADRLRASIDPAFAAQQRFNTEMAHARTLISAGAISLDEYVAKLRLEQAALDAATAAQRHGADSAGEHRAAMQGLSFQAQDTFTQISMGANPLSVIAIQGGQAAGQFANLESKLGKFAKFLIGPWGLAITAGLLVLGVLTDKIFGANKETDDAVDKLKKDAEQTELTRKAKERFGNSLAGVQAAIREQTEALEQSNKANETAAEKANIAAHAELKKAAGIRQSTAAALEAALTEARIERQRAQAPGQRGEIASLGVEQLDSRVSTLQDQLAEAKKAVTDAQALLNGTRANLADEAAQRALDPIERIKRVYEGPGGLIDQAKREAVAQGAVNSTLTKRLTILRQQEQAEIAAEQRRQATLRDAANDNRQTGRSISLSDAESIVRNIGGVITSATRTFDEQRVLYERYLAGKGPLAARPGTSDHERGNALDIAKAPGMSLARIRKAFTDQGVAIKQLLDEGTHFHVAWKQGADGAEAASRKLAETQADLAKQFDPAVSAAIEFRKALDAIAGAKLDPETAKRYGDAARDAFLEARAAAFTLPSIEELRQQNADAEAQKKAADVFRMNVIQPIKDEIALYGLVGPARDKAALELEKEAFIARNMDQGLAVAIERWKEYYRVKSDLIAKDDAAQREADRIKQMADDLNALVGAAHNAGDAFSRAFGRAGSAIGDALSILTEYRAEQERINNDKHLTKQQAEAQSAKLQLSTTIGLIGATKNLFSERSKGYKVMEAAEKALAAVQLVRTAIDVAGGAAKIFSQLGAFAFPVVGAMLGVMAGLGFSGGSGASKPPETNTGTGTVFGDGEAKSESIKRAIDSLKEVDTLTNTYAREMAASLRSIDSQIGNVAALVVRAGNVNASTGVKEGLSNNALTYGIGGFLTQIPIIGGIIKSLFGTKTTIVGSGISGGPQSLADILGGGFDAQYFSDVQKKKRFLGLTYSTKYKTQFADADPALENQFTLILRSFSDAIKAAAGPLGVATTDIQNRLNSFVVSIGKIDLKDLSGQEIQERLTAVFGAAADQMAAAAFPGIDRFQKVGEGFFETLIRVASTVEQVTNSLGMLGQATQALGIDAKMGLADQFDSIGDLTSAAQTYFERFYTPAEQVAARTAQLTRVFTSLGLTMPASLDGFRALVDAQNLTTESGRATYAMLLQLAPAFADLQSSMQGAKSAADILSERQDLERQLLELRGDTAAIRQLDLAKLDVSNRALQEQIYALQDAQDAARAADELRQAWADVGTSIADEIKRIRGLTDPTGDGSFASLMGQFNAATSAARGGDQDAAKQLPALSQALLKAAADAATSRQELERVQAQTAASLEQTFAAISAFATSSAPTSPADALLAAMSASQAATSANATANDNLAEEVAALRAEMAGMRTDMNNGQAAIAGSTSKTARILEKVTEPSGGDAVNVATAA